MLSTKLKTLTIPENISLLFLPPYSPELNPSEKIWWKYKIAFTNRIHKSLDEVKDFISNQVKTMSKNSVKSICDFEYILACPYWTNM